jgi:uncharacterized membrane protein YtjA (UPF0391 family)
MMCRASGTRTVTKIPPLPAAAQPAREHFIHLNPCLNMLRWALIFLVLGLVAALFGFTTVAGTAIGIAKILFYIFLGLFLVALLIGMTASSGSRR